MTPTHHKRPVRRPATPWRDCGKYAALTPEDELCAQAPQPQTWLNVNADGRDCLTGPAAWSYRNEGKAP
jgi:hypothetical protein